MDIDFEDISNAPMMALNTRAISGEAKKLVSTISHLLKQSEQRKLRRKAKDQAAFDLGIELVLSDFLSTLASKRSSWVYRSLFRQSFADEPIGADTFNTITRLMQDNALLETHKGGNVTNLFHQPSTGSKAYYPGLASRFRPGENLLSLASSFGINANNYPDDFLVSLPRKLVRSRAAKGGFHSRMHRGPVIRFEKTDQTNPITNQFQKLNKYLIDQSLEGGTFIGYIRGSNEGNHPDFNWDRGGRLYAVGEKSYQQLDKDERLKMMIDGKPVGEIDINALFLRIFHSLVNQPLLERDDPYQIEGFLEFILTKDGSLCLWNY